MPERDCIELARDFKALEEGTAMSVGLGLPLNQPSFFERYAEAFGVIFSILVVAFGGFTSLKKIRKERIDKYYKRVMNCKNVDELEELSNEAVSQLQNEKLTADESFTIFLNLVEKRRREIEIYPLK